jgi:hypothetical protein
MDGSKIAQAGACSPWRADDALGKCAPRTTRPKGPPEPGVAGLGRIDIYTLQRGFKLLKWEYVT